VHDLPNIVRLICITILGLNGCGLVGIWLGGACLDGWLLGIGLLYNRV